MSLTKLYVGTKTVHASPMTRAAYNVYRGWNLPENENGDDTGFLVEYIDGGKPNDSRHEGYISWSPSDVFEKAYRPVGTFQNRVRAERDDLHDKITKLSAFIAGERWAAVDGVEKGRLLVQSDAMNQYLRTLDDRIAAFVPVQSTQAGYSTAGMLAAILLCAVCVTSFAKGHGNPAALAKYRAEKAAAAKTYTVPSAGKWSKPAGAPAPVSGK